MNAAAPVVSVAMKSYDHAPYVAQAIQSVLDQSFEDFELVVTDDGSTDGTPGIVERFTDPRVRFARLDRNHGIAAAMNATVARARGEFVAILNSDDFALPGRLERQVAFLRANAGVDAVFSAPRQVDERGDEITGFGTLFAPPPEDERPSRHQWLRRFFFLGNSLCAPTAMIRRSAYAAIGADDIRFAHLVDLDRWVRLLAHGEIAVLREPLTAFRVRSRLGNASAPRADTRLRDAFESYQIFKRYRDFAADELRAIFAPDIATCGIDTSGPARAWFGEIALQGNAPWHALLALDALFDGADDERRARRLRDLSGRVNPFRIPTGDEL